MIERLTARYRIVCDRCGKEWEEYETAYSTGLFPVAFVNEDINLGYRGKIADGDVCKECYQDFIDIANNFFDEVNKGGAK